MSDCTHEWDYDTSGGPGVRWCPRCNTDDDCATSLMQAEAEVDRLREVVRQVHALASGSIVHSVSLRAIHNITKGMVE